MVYELITNGRAHVDVVDRNNYQPIHYAAAWGEVEVVEYLMERDADVNAKGGGMPPLLIAAAGCR